MIRFTKKNLEMRVEAENGATAGKTELAKRAKELGLDAIHDTVHEMAKDEARHGKAFKCKTFFEGADAFKHKRKQKRIGNAEYLFPQETKLFP